MAAQPATSYSEMKDILKHKAVKNISSEKVLVTASSVQTEYKIRLGKELHRKTVREYGISRDGYFTKAHSDVFSYQKKGDPQNWGLIMKPEQYLRQVMDFSDKKIQEIKEENGENQ